MKSWKTELLQAVSTLRQIIESQKAEFDLHLSQQLMTMAEMMLRQRLVHAKSMPKKMRRVSSLEPLPDHLDLEACFERFREQAPAAFEQWRGLLDVNAQTYEGFPTHSCSIKGHEMAELFRCFLSPYLSGPTLDIGCGPQPVPVYLSDHPHDLIAGIDPLPPETSHPFTFVQTVAEFLPWPAATFDLVVIATSLDHVFLLDQVFDEIHRVLSPEGFLTIWVSFVAGAEPYDHRRTDLEPIDDYHLFHFDRPWFEATLKRLFVQQEVVTFFGNNESCFYAFQPAGKSESAK